MLLGRNPSGPRRSVIGGGHEYDKDERVGSFFTRRLARFLRRSSAVAAQDEEEDAISSSSLGDRASALPRASSMGVGLLASRRASAGSTTEPAIGAVDPEISFATGRKGAKRRFAVSSRDGARTVNEDRFRVIDDLELYGRALLAVAPRDVPHSYAGLLRAKVLEGFVVSGRAPALRVRSLLRPRGQNSGHTQFYGVYDGHGGARTSSLLALLFPLYVLAAPEFTEDLAAACRSASLALNEEILQREAQGHCEGGSTAVTAFIRGRTLLVSNTGDCRVIIVPKGAKTPALQLTTDHKATNATEKQRVEANGGMILYVKGVARVNGQLAVARAFGNAELQGHVIPDPDVTTHELRPEDEYIVLASDGLWDVLSNDEVATTIRNNPWLSVKELADALSELAVERGSMDNVTVLVVDLRSHAP